MFVLYSSTKRHRIAYNNYTISDELGHFLQYCAIELLAIDSYTL